MERLSSPGGSSDASAARSPARSAPPGPASTGIGGLGAEWPAQLAGTIESVVGAVRDKTVKPATLVAKALVYGPVAAVVGLLTLVMVAVAGVRALDDIPGNHDWISLLGVGGFFTLLGLFSLGRGRSAARKASKG